MKFKDKLKFNNYIIKGWKCACGETYYNPKQAQRILLLNKLKKEKIKLKLGKIRSNLFLRLPKDVELALDLKKGEEVFISLEKDTIKIEK